MRLLALLLFVQLLPAADPLIADTVAFGDPASCAAHHCRGEGRVTGEHVATEMGGLRRTYDVQTVAGSGSRLSFALARVPADPLILEVQEIHQRRPQAFGYTVAVNGVDIYFRTYEELGAGPNHYFVQIPPAVAGGAGPLEVTLTSAGGPPFSIGRVWLYGDFFATIDAAEQVYRPMALMSQSVTAADTGPALTSFTPYGDFHDPSYAKEPYAKTRSVISQSLEHAYATGRPLQLLFNGPTWGGAFAGPDGHGGYCDDVRYSLISYDPGRAAFLPSFPNMWSSRFWATFRDPQLNGLMHRRFLECLRGINDRIDLLRIDGKDPLVVFARELGPPLGEVTAATIAAAAKDGVRLDPRDGLDADERLWLYRDAVRLWQEYAAWHREAIQRDSVVVDRGTVRLPREQLLDNQYAHTVFSTAMPMRDRRWFGGQTGMVEGFWSSGEVFWNRFSQYDYVRANGKFASVNLTITVLKNDCTPLRDLYDAGAQFLTIYQDTPAFAPYLRAADGCEDLPAVPPGHHEPVVLEIAHNLQATMGTPEQVADNDNLRIYSQPLANADAPSTSRLAVADLARPGSITWRVANGGEPFTSGLTLHLDGRIAPGDGNRIEVLAGGTIGELRPVTTLTAAQLPCPDHWEPFMTSQTAVDLGRDLVGRKAGVVRLVFHAQAAPDAAFLLDTRIASQWPRTSGNLAGQAWTRKQQRTLNLWVQDRAVAAHLEERYRELAGEDASLRRADELFSQGRYRSCQRLLSGAISEALPARYVVRGHGRLGRQEIDLRLPSEDAVLVATIDSMGADGCTFAVSPRESRQNFTLTIPGQGRWSLHQLAANRFRLAPDPAGTLLAQDGRISASGEAVRPAEPAAALPGSIVARFLGGDRTAIAIDTQDLALMQCQDSLTLPVAPGAVVTRSPERLPSAAAAAPWPQLHDRVELKLDAQGRVTAISALYGHDRGRIASLSPPSLMGPYSNGVLELDNGNRYEFSYETRIDTVAMHNRYCDYETTMLRQALRPGQQVELDYSPYTDGGTPRRLTRVAQPYRVLLDQDYQDLPAGAWKQLPVAISDVVVGPHKAEPNYLHDVVMQLMRPTAPYHEGSVVYRITSDRPLGMTVAEFGARAYEDSSRVDFAVSTDDGATWIPCGRFDNTWQNCYPQSMDNFAWKNPPQFIDLTRAVEGRRGFLLRLSLFVSPADERYCVSMLRVVGE